MMEDNNKSEPQFGGYLKDIYKAAGILPKTPLEILKEEWEKVTSVHFTEAVAAHLGYAVKAMERYADQQRTDITPTQHSVVVIEKGATLGPSTQYQKKQAVFVKVSVKDRLPEMGKFVPTIDTAGEIIIYRRLLIQTPDVEKWYWNMRDCAGSNSPNNNLPITHWLEETTI